MGTVLAIWHVAKKGKSESLREFAKLLILTYPTYRLIYPASPNIKAGNDFRLIVEINGVIVGIESAGDPNSKLQIRLLELADHYHCDLILCATRTSGETVRAVDYLYHNRGFETIWTSTYQIDNAAQHNLVARLKAKHILDLLVTLGLI